MLLKKTFIFEMTLKHKIDFINRILAPKTWENAITHCSSENRTGATVYSVSLAAAILDFQQTGL